MSNRYLIALFAVAALAAAPAARAVVPSLTIEATGGWQNLQLSTSSVSNAVHGNEGTAIIGGDVLLDLSGLGLGVAVDKTVSGTAQPWAGSLMAGFLVDLTVVRIDLLGELGRRASAFGDLWNSTGQTFVGLRPGVSVRIAPSNFRVGVTGLVRWPTSGGEFGSPDYGILARVGIEFP